MTEVQEQVKSIAESFGLGVSISSEAITTETVIVKKINADIDTQYFALWKAKKKIEEEMDLLKSKITDGLNQEGAIGEKIQCVYVQPSLIFDSAKLKKESLETYEKYLKNKAGYFTIKINEKGE